MLTSIALIFLLGMSLGWLFKKIKMPSLLGMLLTGMILGPYALNVLDGTILSISSELRQIALVIILTRAGLALDINDLKKVGRPAILMCFVPACFEILGMLILAPRLLGVSLIDAAIMGAVVGAVSPAVIVPKMLKLMEEGYGTDKGIPQLIMAGASVDDVFVIVMFTAFLGLSGSEQLTVMQFAQIPISIVTGIIGGGICGYLLHRFFQNIHLRDSSKVILILSLSFLLLALENISPLPFSGLLAIMCIGILIQKQNHQLSLRLSRKYEKLWVGAELLLFVLVGATVDVKYAVSAGLAVVALLFGVLLFRMLGVFICLLKTKLNMKERLFCMIAYMPKATVQAAIGGIPLSMGLASGEIVLTVAVLSILITAPLGAFLIDILYQKNLHKV